MFFNKNHAFLLIEAVVAISIMSVFLVIFVKFQRETIKLDRNSMNRAEAFSELLGFIDDGRAHENTKYIFENSTIHINPSFDLKKRLEFFLDKGDIIIPKFLLNKVSVNLNEKDKERKISLYC